MYPLSMSLKERSAAGSYSQRRRQLKAWFGIQTHRADRQLAALSVMIRKLRQRPLVFSQIQATHRADRQLAVLFVRGNAGFQAASLASLAEPETRRARKSSDPVPDSLCTQKQILFARR